MNKDALRIVSTLLGLVTYIAMQTGRFLLGGVACAINGLIMIYVAHARWMKVVGALVALYGLYIVAVMLGLFIHAALALIDPQNALCIGFALIIVGLQITRRLPERRTLGLLLMVIGAPLVAYGLGFLG